ncbi:hypothetical protein GOBAR_AA22985 [Gossypium barbadense]|uniref:Gag1-like clamp domain-containing protein n=1 Tax=Gossypium barbadense TaxID=3634 RepID=A0A2P5X2W7_GOSBA|nr:hypothetical protein GOBAR_AA22985 [Gossypium barbadense]
MESKTYCKLNRYFGPVMSNDDGINREVNQRSHKWCSDSYELLASFVILKESLAKMFISSGCLGCCARPIFNPLVNESSKGLKFQGQTVSKPNISEGFWTTSTCDMDNSAVQSQGSISSISTSNQTLDPNGNAASLIHWNQTRQRWVGNKKSENQPQQAREPKLNWNATYESLLGSNKLFPQPVPLCENALELSLACMSIVAIAEMIDFLVDVWEQEGLYD